MKELHHTLKVNYYDDELEHSQYHDYLNHQFILDNPDGFASARFALVGDELQTLSEINYLYATADRNFRIIMNEINEFVCQHLSFVNLTDSFSVTITSEVVGLITTNVSIHYGRIVQEV